MSRQIEQALWSLMPTFASDLPPSLIELTGSLVAQSRLKASTLKAEEEVARLYACANIACDRLKITLDLPPIQPRPPIAPKHYKKLHAHLDNVLPQSSTPARSRAGRIRTPSKASMGYGVIEVKDSPSRGTPSKEQILAQWRTGDAATPTKRGQHSLLRPWVRPVVKRMCAELQQEKMAQTVFAGMETITCPAGRPTKDEWVTDNYAALFAAVFYWSLIRFRALTEGTVIPREPAYEQRRQILSLMSQARKTVVLPGADDDVSWKDWSDLKPRDFNHAVATVKERAWLGSSWYKDIDDVVKFQNWDEGDDRVDEDADLSGPIRARLVDTMLQDKTDYLSETRKVNYEAWKADVLLRMAQRKEDAMDIDTQ
ncbi:Origin recognition complex subunit-like protein [Emericellopsis cladophorae]|uniref:Origin recognition complex subunit-like protein n=1 Tax=Emericellopsis cladophorae TaxID=2686198 RepID=A0A9Q0BE09_9HYPO|nr:Origin recognition complex subunit-like protein [Emericellopsis cladophorae]KAI6781371.1 Origin recognition complex subunit-like protein [Emericellopsis cladophorae]